MALVHCQPTDAPSDEARVPLDAAVPFAPESGSPSTDGWVPEGLDAGPTDANADSPSPTFRCPPRGTPFAPAKVKVEVLATGLRSPWSLAFLPNGDLLFTERDGQLRLLRKNGTLEPTPVPGGPASLNAYQGGYLGLALHPDFVRKPFVYLAYARLFPGDPPTAGTRISRFRWDREALTNETPLLDGPHQDDTVVNAGGRLAFGPDQTLYATLGDRHYDASVQTLDNLYGKIVRIRDDGSIPTDNPFFLTPSARKEVFSYGHRNPQGSRSARAPPSFTPANMARPTGTKSTESSPARTTGIRSSPRMRQPREW